MLLMGWPMESWDWPAYTCSRDEYRLASVSTRPRLLRVDVCIFATGQGKPYQEKAGDIRGASYQLDRV